MWRRVRLRRLIPKHLRVPYAALLAVGREGADFT